MYLVSIIPPNNADSALSAFKKDIFQRYEIVSALALLPAVPVLLFNELPGKISRNALPPLPDEGLLFTDLQEEGPQLVLSSDNLKSFTNEITKIFSEYNSSPVPVGVHIADITECSPEAVNFIRRKLKDIPDMVLKWKSCSLAVIKTEDSLFTGSSWWNRIVMETVYEVKFPKVRKR